MRYKCFPIKTFHVRRKWYREHGGLATRDKNKPYILVSKENTGKTVWEQSNVDFRHKGHFAKNE